jgi:hypothetical protein
MIHSVAGKTGDEKLHSKEISNMYSFPKLTRILGTLGTDDEDETYKKRLASLM